MALGINTNISALIAQRNVSGTSDHLQTAIQRLSSGLRINSARDDAAGLAISQRMTSQVMGLNRAALNANDGISLAQTAEGALGQVSSNLQRIRELAVQSANGTNSSSDRSALDGEVQQLLSEIDRVAQATKFNSIALIDGTFTSQKFQIGADTGDVNTVTITSISSSRLSALGLGSLGQASVSGYGGATALAAGDLTINGDAIRATNTTDDVYSTTNKDMSAIAKAAAINASSSATGVTATANAATAAGVTTSSSAVSGTIVINGITTATIAGSGTTLTSLANAANAINAISGQTGVVAVNTNNATTGVLLTAADGRNITLSYTGTLTSGTSGVAAAATYYGGVTLQSSNAIVVAGSTPGNAGLTAGTYSPSGSTTSNVLTVSAANSTITAIDAAITTVNSSRASLGAYQNRFSSAVASLQTTAENLTAARSRVMDADFAAETAALTRASIAQQAGVAMLAQANALPQQVLALLRG